MLLLSVAAVLAPDSYWSRLSTVANYQEDASANDRLYLWNIALSLIPAHPVFGIGPDNFPLYAPNTPHNAYLQVGCEIGLPALMVYVAILLTGLYAAARARKLTSPRKSERPPFFIGVPWSLLLCIGGAVQGFTTGLAHREVVYVFVTLAVCVLSMAEEEPNASESVTGAIREVELIDGATAVLNQ